MRPSATYAAATLAALLLLTACSSDTDPSPDETTTEAASPEQSAGEAPTGTTAEDAELLSGVSIEGEAGVEPTLSFEMPLEISAPAAYLAAPGDGDTLAAGDLALVNFVEVDGTSGEVLSSTYPADRLDPLILGGDTYPALVEELVDQQVGARVLFAVPGASSTSIMGIEVLDATPPHADGTPVEPAEGLPAVTLADDGAPSIEAVDADPPTELVASPTIEGDGKVVEDGDMVLVNYTGWLWDGTEFDSSWSRGAPFSITVGAGQVIEGWETGLAGQTVGSQVLLAIPPELGYGDQDNGTIPPGSTLVFVVDILYAG